MFIFNSIINSYYKLNKVKILKIIRKIWVYICNILIFILFEKYEFHSLKITIEIYLVLQFYCVSSVKQFSFKIHENLNPNPGYKIASILSYRNEF